MEASFNHRIKNKTKLLYHFFISQFYLFSLSECTIARFLVETRFHTKQQLSHPTRVNFLVALN